MDGEICYGALHNVKAKVQGKTQAIVDPDVGRSDDPFAHFPIIYRDRIYYIKDQAAADFAVLDTKTTSQLKVLEDVEAVRYEAVISSSLFSKRYKQRKGGSKLPSIFDLSVNIIGPKPDADTVASRLQKTAAYLQHPQALCEGIDYDNPQFLKFPDNRLNMRELVGITNDPSWARKVKIAEEVAEMFESLATVSGEGMNFLVPPPQLRSTLKSHQEEGLRFILLRESLPFAQSSATALRQLIGDSDTKSQTCFGPVGGMIADVMGLGKTLTILTAIFHSVNEAEEFASFYQAPGDEEMKTIPTKATLVVVSSAQLLENWKAEICIHFNPKALEFYSFHGPRRSRDAAILKSANVVLTTYATLMADFKAQNVLQKLNWYRVVLDEAHYIRNPLSKQFKAAVSLVTERRWCLTGTPIQNRLQDLTSLTEFLQLAPCSDKGSFHKKVLCRLSEGGAKSTQPLRAYLQAYCLRRSQRCLQLPDCVSHMVECSFSDAEKQIYGSLLQEARQEISRLVGQRDGIRCNVLFKAMLKMRMLCNLGTFSSTENAACERCSINNEDTRMLVDSYSSCPNCGRPFRLSSADQNSGSGSLSVSQESRETSFSSVETPVRLGQQGVPSSPGGFSTKLQTVVQKVLEGGDGSKNIVFSSWTSTLDHLAEMFDHALVPVLRVDGRVSYADRNKRLESFKTDPNERVLLISIETGALGLTLTVANRVHLVEPQWNPSVEEQAIGRALRMGQTRTVEVFRYVVTKTVEKNILDLQKKKKNLAKFTFDTEKDDDSLSETFRDLISVVTADEL